MNDTWKLTRIGSYPDDCLTEIALDSKILIIGREGEKVRPHHRIPCPHISKYHALFTFSNFAWSVRDLNSHNGVYVNRVKIAPDVEIRIDEGDKIGFGYGDPGSKNVFVFKLVHNEIKFSVLAFEENTSLENPGNFNSDTFVDDNFLTEDEVTLILLNMRKKKLKREKLQAKKQKLLQNATDQQGTTKVVDQPKEDTSPKQSESSLENLIINGNKSKSVEAVHEKCDDRGYLEHQSSKSECFDSTSVIKPDGIQLSVTSGCSVSECSDGRVGSENNLDSDIKEVPCDSYRNSGLKETDTVALNLKSKSFRHTHESSVSLNNDSSVEARLASTGSISEECQGVGENYVTSINLDTSNNKANPSASDIKEVDPSQEKSSNNNRPADPSQKKSNNNNKADPSQEKSSNNIPAKSKPKMCRDANQHWLKGGRKKKCQRNKQPESNSGKNAQKNYSEPESKASGSGENPQPGFKSKSADTSDCCNKEKTNEPAISHSKQKEEDSVFRLNYLIQKEKHPGINDEQNNTGSSTKDFHKRKNKSEIESTHRVSVCKKVRLETVNYSEESHSCDSNKTGTFIHESAKSDKELGNNFVPVMNEGDTLPNNVNLDSKTCLSTLAADEHCVVEKSILKKSKTEDCITHRHIMCPSPDKLSTSSCAFLSCSAQSQSTIFETSPAQECPELPLDGIEEENINRPLIKGITLTEEISVKKPSPKGTMPTEDSIKSMCDSLPLEQSVGIEKDFYEAKSCSNNVSLNTDNISEVFSGRTILNRTCNLEQHNTLMLPHDAASNTKPEVNSSCVSMHSLNNSLKDSEVSTTNSFTAQTLHLDEILQRHSSVKDDSESSSNSFQGKSTNDGKFMLVDCVRTSSPLSITDTSGENILNISPLKNANMCPKSKKGTPDETCCGSNLQQTNTVELLPSTIATCSKEQNFTTPAVNKKSDESSVTGDASKLVPSILFDKTTLDNVNIGSLINVLNVVKCVSSQIIDDGSVANDCKISAAKSTESNPSTLLGIEMKNTSSSLDCSEVQKKNYFSCPTNRNEKSNEERCESSAEMETSCKVDSSLDNKPAGKSFSDSIEECKMKCSNAYHFSSMKTQQEFPYEGTRAEKDTPSANETDNQYERINVNNQMVPSELDKCSTNRELQSQEGKLKDVDSESVIKVNVNSTPQKDPLVLDNVDLKLGKKVSVADSSKSSIPSDTINFSQNVINILKYAGMSEGTIRKHVEDLLNEVGKISDLHQNVCNQSRIEYIKSSPDSEVASSPQTNKFALKKRNKDNDRLRINNQSFKPIIDDVSPSKQHSKIDPLMEITEGSVSSKKRELLSKCHRSTVKADTDSLIAFMVSWNPQWLQEYLENTLHSPLNVQRIKPYKLEYESFEDYISTFSSGLLLQSWKSVYHNWKEVFSKHENTIFQSAYLGVLVNERRNLKTLKCLVELPAELQKASFYPAEGHLVCLELFTKNGKMASELVFGYVYENKLLKYSDLEILPPVLNVPKNESLMLNLKVFVRFDLETVDENKVIKITLVAKVITLLRQIEALEKMFHSPFQSCLVQPSVNYFYFKPKVSFLVNVDDVYFDEQSSAISSVFSAVTSSGDDAQICLIHGLPGTGKTHTILGIVQHIISIHSDARFLILAPSNASIDEIGCRLLWIRNRQKLAERKMKIVRVGDKLDVNPHLHGICLDHLVQKNVNRETANKIEELEGKITQKEELKFALEKRLKSSCEVNDMITETNLKFELNLVRERIKALEETKQKLLLNTKQISHQLVNTKVDVLRKANVILATVEGCRCGIMEKTFGKNSCTGFTCCIVDDSTYCSELEILPCFMYPFTKLVLAGDYNQGTATEGFNKSLFERYGNFLIQVSSTPPIHTLKMQGRMVPEIASFPSSYFYGGQLTSSCHQERAHASCPFKPYILFDIVDSQEVWSDTDFWYNREEVQFVEIVYKLIISLAPKATVGILTPFQNQKKLLSSVLRSYNHSPRLKIDTIEGFQGQEKEVIVLSCVRTGHMSCEPDTLMKPWQIKIATTRARCSFIIIGCMSFLKKSKDLEALYINAVKRNCVHKISFDCTPVEVLKHIQKH